MQRRRFLSLLASIPVLSLLAKSAGAADEAAPAGYDPDYYAVGLFKTLEMRRLRMSLPPATPKLYFNGEDWTCRADQCNTREGWAREIVKVHRDGHIADVQRHRRYGKVELRAH